MYYGAPRDLLLGLRFVNAKGQLICAGGKVVKNVAGYDVTRMITGSAGTLGFITAANLRIAMLPQKCIVLTAKGNPKKWAGAAAEVLQSRLMPVFVAATPAWADLTTASAYDWQIAIGFEGFLETVEYQVEKASKLLPEKDLENVTFKEYDVTNGFFGPSYEKIKQKSFVCRIDTAPLQITDCYEQAVALLPDMIGVLDFGCGRIWAGTDGIDDDIWVALQDAASRYGGTITLLKAPQVFKPKNTTFGPYLSAWKLSQRLKETLDPDHVFAENRLPLIEERSF
jgi:FAD/FMN-containing dehydrogenase